MLYRKYYEEITTMLERIIETQHKEIEKAAELVSNVIKNDGLLYVFGCGHSHIIGEDLFYRACGFAPVCAMLDSGLMLHEGAVKSSLLERTPGIARAIFDRYKPASKDALMIVSQSGINAVPTEMAQCAKQNKVPVIAITSGTYACDPTRTVDGTRLSDHADILIDNCVCHGDGSVTIPGTEKKAGPLSTISASMIAQCIMVQTAENLQNAGMDLPVYVSGNIPGGAAANQALIEEYRMRIKHL